MIDLEIKEATDCTGCYACTSICPEKCISMPSDEEGFWYPSVDHERCIKCGLCIKVCPIINKATIDNEPHGYAVINRSLDDRLTSSSGGMFSVLARWVLSADGIVFGAAFDEGFQVKHISIDNLEQLPLLKGSKYVQSKIGETYTEAKRNLNTGRMVLFSGTPCQIAGLLTFLGKDYPNLLTADIICHGVPSPKVWAEYLLCRTKNVASKISRISFRDKVKGWKRFSLAVEYANGSRYSEPLDKDLYLRAFLKDICLRPSCYDCEFKGIHRQSDITLADFWGVGKLMPEINDDIGTSLVMVNTSKGNSVLQSISDDVDFRAVDLDTALASNTAALRSAAVNPKRSSFMAEIDKISFDAAVRKYCSDSSFIIAKRRVRSVLSKVKRLVLPK